MVISPRAPQASDSDAATRDARTRDRVLAMISERGPFTAADLRAIADSYALVPLGAAPETALAAGIPVIEINPEATPLSAAASYHWQGTAATTLPALVAAINAGAARP